MQKEGLKTKERAPLYREEEVDFLLSRADDAFRADMGSEDSDEDHFAYVLNVGDEDKKKAIKKIVERARAGDDFLLIAVAERALQFMRNDLLSLEKYGVKKGVGENLEADQEFEEALREKHEQYDHWQSIVGKYLLESENYSLVYEWKDVAGWLDKNIARIYATLAGAQQTRRETVIPKLKALERVLAGRDGERDHYVVRMYIERKIKKLQHKLDSWVFHGIQAGKFAESGGYAKKVQEIVMLNEFLGILEQKFNHMLNK